MPAPLVAAALVPVAKRLATRALGAVRAAGHRRRQCQRHPGRRRRQAADILSMADLYEPVRAWPIPGVGRLFLMVNSGWSELAERQRAATGRGRRRLARFAAPLATRPKVALLAVTQTGVARWSQPVYERTPATFSWESGQPGVVPPTDVFVGWSAFGPPPPAMEIAE